MGFLVIRLGKDSVATINKFNQASTRAPFSFDFTCTQVEQTIEIGDYAFIYLGSDNNKGVATAWKQGLRGLARIEDLDRGEGFNDDSTFSLEVVSVFPTSLDQFDFLERSATLYKHFSVYPIIGIKSSRNNAAQRVREGRRENTAALLTAIKLLYPGIVNDLTQNAPDLLASLDYIPDVDDSAISGTLPDSDDPTLMAVREAIGRNELNFLFLGPPGTGKTWHAYRVANALAEADGNRISLLQFHPSISYDDFVEGYAPTLSSDKTSIKYEIKPKHFIKLCDAARADGGNLYVMVIDEISRGDPSRVFGEMLTYIEPQYRDRTFTLGYSGRPYRVPANVIILATANPYDRSVGELDDAFLRRFEIIEFEPSRDVLAQSLSQYGASGPFKNKVVHFFTELNSVVPNGLGHSYFLKLQSEDDMVRLWASKLSFIVRRMLQYETDKFETLDQTFNRLFVSSSLDSVELDDTAGNDGPAVQ